MQHTEFPLEHYAPRSTTRKIRDFIKTVERFARCEKAFAANLAPNDVAVQLEQYILSLSTSRTTVQIWATSPTGECRLAGYQPSPHWTVTVMLDTPERHWAVYWHSERMAPQQVVRYHTLSPASRREDDETTVIRIEDSVPDNRD